ncbi:MAG: hypothetical protein P1T08_12805 [Acidimicrobiia bacterium]|nr:hypothetical protein [Acidimicrobiia bacterium]
MATWIRLGTGTAPSTTDAALVGNYALDNSTAPPDLDPAAVTSIRTQWTVTGSGFVDDSWDNVAGVAVVTGATEISQHPGEGSTGNQNIARSSDHTDSTGIPTGLSVADWEAAVVRGDGVSDAWCLWNKVKGADGSTLAASALTVTITYTPAAAVAVLEQDHFGFFADGTAAGSAALNSTDRDAVTDKDTIFHLRVGVKNTGTAESATINPKLQYSYMAEGTGGAVNWTAWTDVNGASARVNSIASADIVDNESLLTQRVSTGSFAGGRADEADGTFTTGRTIAAGVTVEWLWVLELDSADIVSDQEEFRFRVVEGDGSLFDAYNVEPHINPTLVWTHGFEGGVDGAEVNTTIADTDTIDGIQRTTPATGIITYDTAVVHDGLVSCEINYTAGGTAAHKLRWYDLNQAEVGFLRLYLYYPSLPSTDHRIAQATEHTDLITPFAIHIDATNKIQLRDNSGVIATATTALSVATWYRIELNYASETATGVGDGTLLVRYYEGDSVTLIQEIGLTGTAVTGTEWEDLDLGVFSDVTQHWYVDAIELGNTDWIGPLASTPTGSAAGAISWVGTADGVATYEGSSSGAVSWVGSADGATTHQGSAAGAISWVGTADGVATYEGSSSGAVSWVGSADGATTHQGSAAGAISWVGAADGATVHEGSAAGAVGWVGSATGVAPTGVPEGTATGSISWVGSADGVAVHEGSSAGSVSWVGSADGATTHQGSATGSVAWSGTADGAVVHEGDSTGSIVWVGSADGAVTHEGSSTGAVGWVGSADGVTVHEGAVAGSMSWVGSADGVAVHEGAVAGSMSWVGSADGVAASGIPEGSATGNISWVGTAYGTQPFGFIRQPVGFIRQPVGFIRQPVGFIRQPVEIVRMRGRLTHGAL